MNLSEDLCKIYSVQTAIASFYFAKFKYGGIYLWLSNVTEIWNEEIDHELKGQKLELTHELCNIGSELVFFHKFDWITGCD